MFAWLFNRKNIVRKAQRWPRTGLFSIIVGQLQFLRWTAPHFHSVNIRFFVRSGHTFRLSKSNIPQQQCSECGRTRLRSTRGLNCFLFVYHFSFNSQWRRSFNSFVFHLRQSFFFHWNRVFCGSIGCLSHWMRWLDSFVFETWDSKVF